MSCVPDTPDTSTPLDSNSLTAVASLAIVLKLTVVTYGTPLFCTQEGAKLCREFATTTTLLKSPPVLRTLYNPEPTGWVHVEEACAWNHFLSRIPVYAPARFVSNGRLGADRSSSTVEGLITLVVFKPFNKVAVTGDLVAGFSPRSNVNFTSWAVSGSPLEKTTFLRRVNVRRFPPLDTAYFVARLPT